MLKRATSGKQQAYSKAIDVIMTMLSVCVGELVDEITMQCIQSKSGTNCRILTYCLEQL